MIWFNNSNNSDVYLIYYSHHSQWPDMKLQKSPSFSCSSNQLVKIAKNLSVTKIYHIWKKVHYNPIFFWIYGVTSTLFVPWTKWHWLRYYSGHYAFLLFLNKIKVIQRKWLLFRSYYNYSEFIAISQDIDWLQS